MSRFTNTRTAINATIKAKVKPVPKAAAQTVEPKPEVADEVVEPVSPMERLHQRVTAAYEDFFAQSGEASPRRRLVAWVAGAVVAFAAGYCGGYISALLMATVIMATTSLFLGFVVYLLGILLSIYLGASAGFYVQQFVLNANRKMYDSAKARVIGWFDFGNKEHAHA